MSASVSAFPVVRVGGEGKRLRLSAPSTLSTGCAAERAYVTDFVVAAARAAAEHRVEQEQVIRLSLEDQRAFVEAVLNPPEPTPALRRAFERHRELIDESR